MARVEIDETVQTPTGDAITGASVQVNKRGGGSATVYSADTGGSTRSNPLLTDAFGRVDGWLEEGSYDLVVSANGTIYTQPFEAAVGGGRGPVFNVKDAAYGAKGDGPTTDDTAAIQAAIAACIAAGGGTVYFPPGAYLIASTLDLSAVKGTRAVVILRGAGGGEGVASTIDTSTTRLLNATGTTLIKAWGQQNPSLQEIYGVQVRDLGIKNTVAMGASDYVIDFDLISGMVVLENVYIYGANLSGNGIQFRNMAQGQSSWRNVKTRGFATGTGIKVAAEATTVVTAPFNSGNCTFISCLAMDCTKGWHIRDAGTLLNGCSFISCKAVNSSSLPTPDIAGSIGFHLDGVEGEVLIAPHAERFETSIQIDGSVRDNVIINPVCIYTTAASALPAGAAAIKIAGDSWSNFVHNARISSHATNGWDYGVLFTGNAESNYATGRDVASARVKTAVFSDQSTVPTNSYWNTEASRHRVWGVTESLPSSSFTTGAGGAISLNADKVRFAVVSVTGATVFTINAPSNPATGMEITYEIQNNSGGAMGAITWNAIFKLAGAFTNPATGKIRTISFYYNGANWIERNRAAADI